MRPFARLNSALVPLAGLAPALVRAAPASAAEPEEWQLGLQAAASPVMARIDSFHDFLLVITFAIAGLVMGLLLFVMVRFRARRNPTPARTTHNTTIEVLWTVVPTIILLVIAVPSFRLLYFMDRAVEPEMTLKVTGSQWYWSYAYPDHGGFAFDSQMVPEAEIKAGQRRLLEVDKRAVVPVDTDIRVLVTANVVIHSWAVPALGVKTDAVPGRMNETWMRIDKPGIYYGQCSELCGVGHAFMPVAVEAVSKADFAAWAAAARERFGASPAPRREGAGVTLARSPAAGPAAR